MLPGAYESASSSARVISAELEIPGNKHVTKVSNESIQKGIENIRVDNACPDALLNDRLGIVGCLLFKPAGMVSSCWGHRLFSGFLFCSGYGSASTAIRSDLRCNLCRYFNLVVFHPAKQ